MSVATPPPAASWRIPLSTLAVAAAVLAAALLGPRAFSDPYGVDPYSLRLGGAVLLLLVGACWSARTRAAAPVLLAVVGVVVPYVAWSATPRVLHDTVLARAPGTELFFWATAVQMALTLAVLWLARRRMAANRPVLRLRGLSRGAAAVSAGGGVLLLGIALLLPAMLLGRLGVAPVSLGRDFPWLGPGDVLQAAAQEFQFRGLLLGELERSMPPWAANLAQATLFGLAHIAVDYEGPAAPFVPLTIALGLVLGWVTQRTRSVWPAVVVHAVGELAVTIAVLPGLYGQ